jgi:hypothetical protein
MQRREAKSGVKDRKCHRRPNERNDTGENPHRNGLSGVGVWICGFVGLDGGVRSHTRTGLGSHPLLFLVICIFSGKESLPFAVV